MAFVLPPLPDDYARRLPRCVEAAGLVRVATDSRGRDILLAPTAAEAWRAMQTAAAGDGSELVLVSGFRTIARQAEILRRKLERGILWPEILRQNAYPGFSEHHTGRAVDIATPAHPRLEESFANTPAFAWLAEHAGRFGFHLTYPRGNLHGLAFEPWHWCWREN